MPVNFPPATNDIPLHQTCLVIWVFTGIIAATGIIALFGVFWKMKGGFGPHNLRAVCITLVLTFTALIAVENQNGIMTAAIGIFGSIAMT